MSNIPDSSVLRSATAWILGWVATVLILGAAILAEGGYFAGPILFVAPFVVAIYVILVGPIAYGVLDRLASVDRFGRRSWRAYCLTALAATTPYFLMALVLPTFGLFVGFGRVNSSPFLWLAALLASLTYGSIGYWFLERGWPWHWRRHDKVEDGWRRT